MSNLKFSILSIYIVPNSYYLLYYVIFRLMEQARKEGMSRDQMQALLQQNKNSLNTAVTMADFELSLSKVNKSVSEHDLTRYQEWMQEFGSS